MKWFRISLIELSTIQDGDSSGPTSGIRIPSSNGIEYIPPEAYMLYCDFKNLAALDALIGVVEKENSTFPSDWMPLSVDEAKQVFTEILGTEPTSEQVY